MATLTKLSDIRTELRKQLADKLAMNDAATIITALRESRPDVYADVLAGLNMTDFHVGTVVRRLDPSVEWTS